GVPRVTVMHDLAFEHYPKDLGFLVRRYLQYFSPKYAQASDQIIAVSEYTKQDIVKTYSQPASKINVVYNDASDFFKPISEKEQETIKRIYSQGQDYFIFVGAIHPRKNLVNLFKAFDKFKKQLICPVKLLIVGREGWNYGDIKQTYEQMKFKDDVLFTGRVSDQELVRLYGAALASVYVPYFEGFGIPIVEAQKCNCPVITSIVTSMPEVAGDAALLVDPFSVDEIASAMIDVYRHPDLRQDLIKLGQENLKRFSWQKSADQIMVSLRKAVQT
ncbi:MAG: glycosyltransferase family 4 protein, partial [Hymenobacteraceae bacterium]|nr:glycosyltransferase family 4 protein [Hymenobacteraceae bacterium]MDX5395685.1 glycosyltransferase family 4 protein [Hymenobacteraceae bacterium]MDX5511739.1 glycosyltransferase family 4 protein [Hymenobacteraceae bacterium]